MPVTNVTTDYTDRTKDVSIAYKVNPSSSEVQTIKLSFGTISSYCAGVQKLIQRYMIVLLTEKGSQEDSPLFGTDLMTKLRYAGRMNISQVRHTFNFANAEVVSAFRKFQTKNTGPLDEQLDTAVLETVTVANGQLNMGIRIYTMAGNEVSVIAPIPIQ